MAIEREEGFRVEKLTKTNKDLWFRSIEAKLGSKGVLYVTEKSLVEYAQVASVGGITEGLEDLTIDDEDATTTAERQPVKKTVRLNIEKREKYEKDNYIALSIILQAVHPDDSDAFDDYKRSVSDWWAATKKKYSETNTRIGNQYVSQIQNFTWKKNTNVQSTWAELKGIRRKLVAVSDHYKAQYDDEVLYMILTDKAPQVYRPTVRTLEMFDGKSVEDRILSLESAEIYEGINKLNDKAHIAGGKYNIPQRRRPSAGSDTSMKSRSNSPDNSKIVNCFLCNKEGHVMINCRWLDFAKEQVTAEIQALERDARKRARRRARIGTGKSFKKTPHKHKAHATADSNPDNDSDSTDSDSDVEEQANITIDQIRTFKSNPVSQESTWPADSACTRHMSDQLSLFRSIKPCRRRIIRVGGGVLHAEYTGTVVIICKDGSQGLLKNVLYVPKLGVNLISARRICEGGLEGRFSSTEMYFTKDGKRIIEAKLQDGLYIVTHIAENYKEKALTTQVTGIDKQEKAVIDTYLLMHRRFNHLGPEKIRNLHKVTTLSKPIKIPKQLPLCHVCSLSKMKNKIRKELSPRKDCLFALIQFDIAGPLPRSIRGNRYFLLIVDNWSNEEWFIPLKHKSDAPAELAKWKMVVELRTDLKVRAARSDNAPELIQAVEDWESGVQHQTTTIASSH